MSTIRSSSVCTIGNDLASSDRPNINLKFLVYALLIYKATCIDWFLSILYSVATIRVKMEYPKGLQRFCWVTLWDWTVKTLSSVGSFTSAAIDTVKICRKFGEVSSTGNAYYQHYGLSEDLKGILEESKVLLEFRFFWFTVKTFNKFLGFWHLMTSLSGWNYVIKLNRYQMDELRKSWVKPWKATCHEPCLQPLNMHRFVCILYFSHTNSKQMEQPLIMHQLTCINSPN